MSKVKIHAHQHRKQQYHGNASLGGSDELFCGDCGLEIVGKYYTDNVGNHVHADCRTQTCHCCGQFIWADAAKGAFQFSDGRVLCGCCRESVVIDDTAVWALSTYVKELLCKAGVHIPRTDSITLVSLNVFGGNSDDASLQNGLATTQRTILNGQVSYHHSVEIVTGLSEVKCAGVLAHELMHTWLNERNVHLTMAHTEGFCNLGSAFIYIKAATPESRIHLKNLYKDPDPVYGDGFRAMSESLRKRGWKNLLKTISS